MAKGTVKWFDNSKGYGFVRAEGEDKDIFVHHSCIQAEGFRTLKEGESVQFEVVQGPKGLKAENVIRLEAAAQPSQQPQA
ncbi:MAG TPA: cold shock domain-containing protein [Phycisphaerae bacterium]|nr:cold shock domain-containing protein [Phycisphaerae bacterium]